MNLSQIIENIPSCTGIDDWAHRPMIVSNEIYDETFEKMSQLPTEGNLMIAVSGFFALNIFAIRQNLEYLLLLDRGDRVYHFWGEIKEIVDETDTRSEAIKKINQLILRNCERYFGGSPFWESGELAIRNIAYLHNEIVEGQSWLSDDARYQRIKSHFTAHRIAVKQMDLCNVEKVRRLGFMLKAYNLSTDVIYLSNVPEYAKQERRLTQFYKGISILLSGRTYVINAVLSEGLLEQRIVQKGGLTLRAVWRANGSHIFS